MPLRPALVRLLPALLVGLVVATGAAQAGKVYKWTDRNGVVHYGDRPPDANAVAKNVKVIPVQAQPGAMVRLRVENADGAYMA